MLALVFAALAVRSTSRTNQAQAKQIEQLEQDRKDRDEERRSEQAAKVALWVTASTVDGVDQPAIRLTNRSGLPVYKVLVVFSTPTGMDTQTYTVLGPPASGRRTLRRASALLADLIADGEFKTMLENGDLLAACSFRDTAGRWWSRTVEGELRSAKDREAAEEAARRSAERTLMQH